MQTPFVALVPVKSPDHGKSRLLEVGDPDRRALARAFALDTITAVRATPAVRTTVVVTDDAEVARLAPDLGCLAVDDTGGLNASLRAAAAGVTGMVVAVCADLPALRSRDLADALDRSRPGEASYVADHHGTGTTTYAAPADAFDPRFGPGSAAVHRALGVRPVAGELTTLRRDVDTVTDLLALAHAGLLGQHTADVVATISLPRQADTSAAPTSRS